MPRLKFIASFSFCTLVNWKPYVFLFIFSSFSFFISFLISHICCLNIHWQLSACWMLIPKINPKQQIRKWNFTAKDQMPPHGGKVTKSSIRGKCQRRSAKLTVWLVPSWGWPYSDLLIPLGFIPAQRGLPPPVGLGPEPAADHQWFPKKPWNLSQILPTAASFPPFLSHPQFSSNSTNGFCGVPGDKAKPDSLGHCSLKPVPSRISAPSCRNS